MRIPDNRISRLFIKREYLSKLPEPDRSISKKEVRKVLGVSVAILVIIIELSIIFDLYSKLYYGLIGYGSLMDEPVNGLRSVEAEMEEVFSLDEPSTDWNWLCISHENGLPVQIVPLFLGVQRSRYHLARYTLTLLVTEVIFILRKKQMTHTG